MLSVVGRNFSSSSHRLLLNGNLATTTTTTTSRVISSKQRQIPHYRFQQQGHYNNRKTHVVTPSLQQQQKSKVHSKLWLAHTHHPRPSLSSSGLTRSSSSLSSSSSSLLSELRGRIPTFIWAMSGVGIVGSFLSGRELFLAFFPPELVQHWEKFAEIDELEHHTYPFHRLSVEPFAYSIYALVIAAGYKLESVSSLRRTTKTPRVWVPRYGSRRAALCITGINVAVGLALNNMFYFPNNETYFKELLGFVPRDVYFEIPEKWFRTIGSETMTPYKRELFLREQWYHLGKTVVVMPGLDTILFFRLLCRNVLFLTNPVTAIGLIPLVEGFYIFGIDESSRKEGDLVHVPISDFLWNMTTCMAYVATGRLLVPFVAMGMNKLMLLIRKEPSTLPFQLSVGVSTDKTHNGSNFVEEKQI